MKEKIKEVKEWRAEHNPFMVRNDDGRLIRYQNKREAYEMILLDLFTNFPLGFIDIPLFLMARQQLSPKECKEICGNKEYLFVTWWGVQYPHVYGKLHKLLQLLLKPSGFPLDEQLFVDSVENINKLLTNTEARENLRMKDNLFIISKGGIEAQMI